MIRKKRCLAATRRSEENDGLPPGNFQIHGFQGAGSVREGLGAGNNANGGRLTGHVSLLRSSGRSSSEIFLGPVVTRGHLHCDQQAARS